MSIAYIGYAEQRTPIEVEAGKETVSALVLDMCALEEVTVFGTRSERAKALSQQRAAENSTFTVTTDTLGNFSGTTISEALRRVPGVAFQRDERTGDGTNIILRGLAPDMNAIQLNGLNLPVANGLDRSASLNNLLADSVDRITVHHSLLPSMNSAGSGGLVEIETKSPLQRGRRYVNFGVEAGRTADPDFSNDILGTGTVSGTFGEQETFGLSAAVQYRKRELQTISYNTNLIFGQALPLERDGSLEIYGREQVDPRVVFPFEPGIDQAFPSGFGNAFVDSDIETLAATLSSEWRINERTNLRLDIQRSQSETATFSRSSRVDMSLCTRRLPVAALGGEVRQALAWDGQASMNGYYEFGQRQGRDGHIQSSRKHDPRSVGTPPDAGSCQRNIGPPTGLRAQHDLSHAPGHADRSVVHQRRRRSTRTKAVSSLLTDAAPGGACSCRCSPRRDSISSTIRPITSWTGCRFIAPAARTSATRRTGARATASAARA